MKQIAELIERYPDVFYIWNDGLDTTIMPADKALAFFRGFGRAILACSNWWDWGRKGALYADIAVKEMGHFPETNTSPGETCWCLEESWFWSKGASPKTARQVADLLTMANGRNSNFLLNAGPNKQGRLEPASVKVLAEVGKLQKTDGPLASPK
jgi:alpha-L-fucosidase